MKFKSKLMVGDYVKIPHDFYANVDEDRYGKIIEDRKFAGILFNVKLINGEIHLYTDRELIRISSKQYFLEAL